MIVCKLGLDQEMKNKNSAENVESAEYAEVGRRI